jgi:hypothetical protein
VFCDLLPVFYINVSTDTIIAVMVCIVMHQDLDMLAAQLNELGVAQPEAPARSRQNGKSSSSSVGGSSSHNALPAPPSSLPQSTSSILDAAVESDSDEGEDGIGVRNDGTLLASDPPKPL